MNHGVIERDSAAIFCNRPTSIQFEYLYDDIIEFTDRFGITPQNAVVIDISRGDGSRELALQFAGCIVQRWGGFVDENAIFDDIDPGI